MDNVTSLFKGNHGTLKRHREAMLQEIMDLLLLISNYISMPQYEGRDPFKDHKNLAERFNEVQKEFYIYGYNDEIDAIVNFIDALLAKNSQSIMDAFKVLAPLARARLRKELGLES